ncbi:hypothetical protein OK016_24705 [Vibrio chagasii]|nr:hypothetical protein [Vibrio chagasii]
MENEAYPQLRTFILKVISSFENLATKAAQADEENESSSEALKNIIQERIPELDKAINDKSIHKENCKKEKETPPAQLVNQKLRELERAKQAHQKALD